MFRKFLRSPSKIASVDIYDNYKTEDFFFFFFVFFLMMRWSYMKAVRVATFLHAKTRTFFMVENTDYSWQSLMILESGVFRWETKGGFTAK